jgi:hypothetical protein
MSQTEAFIRAAKVQDRLNRIEGMESELQCMESHLSQGFTLKDYIDMQKYLIEILKGFNDKEVER